MNIEEFFKLSEEEQAKIIKIHRYVKGIKDRAAFIKESLEEYNRQYRALQEECEHPTKTCKTIVELDMFRSIITSSEFYCPACDKRWIVRYNE